ncbi:MAG TPA: hypothetical protein VFW50_28790, partial [Streptosporangiaceae bacterium]|nr:hypothetical protein [Streptosporangiaceae bacterium]
MTPASLAARTGTTERYVREWLGNQAAGGYVTYDPADGTFELPAEQAMVLANEDSPVFLSGAFEAIASCYADHDRFVDAFRTGAGVGWHEHDGRLFSGVLRLFRPGYAANLVSEWLPDSPGAGPGRHAAAGGADGRRRRRGQPEPARPDLLRPVHGDLHAGVAGPGGRPGARRPGGGAPA